MNRSVLKIFTDRSYLPEGCKHCLLLIPFWGDMHPHDGYARLEQVGKEFLQLVAENEAEVALLPFDGSHLLDRNSPFFTHARQQAARFVERARASHLKTLIIVNSDSIVPIDLPEIIVFRTSLNSRTRAPHEFALPAWHEDLVKNRLGGQLKIRERSHVPTAGFCGLTATSGPPLKRRIKIVARRLCRPLGIHIEHNDGIYLRRDAMKALSECPEVRTQFVPRAKYFGGAADEEQQQARVRLDYVENLISSDYALSARGYGNFSFRFFEALSVGRIPILIDTECVLPYDFLHDYRQFCVVVPECRVQDTGHAVRDFHAALSPEGFRELQQRIRDFWVEWLSPEGFFGNLPLHWRERGSAV